MPDSNSLLMYSSSIVVGLLIKVRCLDIVTVLIKIAVIVNCQHLDMLRAVLANGVPCLSRGSTVGRAA